MAQKRKRKNRKKLLFWLTMLVLVAVAVGICYLVWQTYFSGDSNKQEDETSKTEEEKDEINENNGVVVDENGDEIEIEGKEKVTQYEGENPNKAQDLSGAITFAEVVDGKLMIRMNIDQAKEFVERTGCDSLAIAFGTSHRAYQWEHQIQHKIQHKIQHRIR